MAHSAIGDVINLNVGGKRFSTSRQTLSWMPDTFFTALLSGRISTLRDETGAIFIDRDPSLFRCILQYLRTREINTKGYDIGELRHEAEFYGVSGLVKRLSLCQDLTSSSCGDVLFCGYLAPPSIPVSENGSISSKSGSRSSAASGECGSGGGGGVARHSRNPSQDYRQSTQQQQSCEAGSAATAGAHGSGAARSSMNTDGDSLSRRCHSRTPSLDCRHSRNSSADLNKLFKIDIGVLNSIGSSGWVDPLRVRIVKAHHNWIVVAYAHFVTCYRNKDSTGWQLAFRSPRQEQLIERVAINAKMSGAGQQAAAPAADPQGGVAAANTPIKMLAISFGANIKLWGVGDDGTRVDVGTFHLGVPVEYLFFIGYQLVALSSIGKIGVWHAMTRNWQTQDILPIASFDTAGSFLLLGCTNGSIYYIDMQKFPLRMKDNDLLVTELYHDPSNDVITAISVYLTPKTNVCGNWIEIAYGTSSGTVRVIVQHPETVGHGPQLFQTFTVHRHSVTKVRLSEKLLISVCGEYNHVRTWSVMRFRGMISTQPGSTPLSSYKILTLEESDQPLMCAPHANEIGPYGEQDDEQVFIQKVVPDTDELIVRLASKGKRVCAVKSVDASSISAFCVHECDGRIGSTRPRRYLFTGHTSGAIQMWDLTTALDMVLKPQQSEDGGPEPHELLRLLETCELTYSHGTTPCVSPSPHATGLLHSYQVHSNFQSLVPTIVGSNTLAAQLQPSATQQQPASAQQSVPSKFVPELQCSCAEMGLKNTVPQCGEPIMAAATDCRFVSEDTVLPDNCSSCEHRQASYCHCVCHHHCCPARVSKASQTTEQSLQSCAKRLSDVSSDSESAVHSAYLVPMSEPGATLLLSGPKLSSSCKQHVSSPPHRPHLPSLSKSSACDSSVRGGTHGNFSAVQELKAHEEMEKSTSAETSSGYIGGIPGRVSSIGGIVNRSAGRAVGRSNLLKPSNVAFLSQNQQPGSAMVVNRIEIQELDRESCN